MMTLAIVLSVVAGCAGPSPLSDTHEAYAPVVESAKESEQESPVKVWQLSMYFRESRHSRTDDDSPTEAFCLRSSTDQWGPPLVLDDWPVVLAVAGAETQRLRIEYSGGFGKSGVMTEHWPCYWSGDGPAPGLNYTVLVVFPGRHVKAGVQSYGAGCGGRSFVAKFDVRDGVVKQEDGVLVE